MTWRAGRTHCTERVLRLARLGAAQLGDGGNDRAEHRGTRAHAPQVHRWTNLPWVKVAKWGCHIGGRHEPHPIQSVSPSRTPSLEKSRYLVPTLCLAAPGHLLPSLEFPPAHTTIRPVPNCADGCSGQTGPITWGRIYRWGFSRCSTPADDRFCRPCCSLPSLSAASLPTSLCRRLVGRRVNHL